MGKGIGRSSSGHGHENGISRPVNGLNLDFDSGLLCEALDHFQ